MTKPRSDGYDLSKLPKWAKALIGVLEQDLEYHRKRSEEALRAAELADSRMSVSVAYDREPIHVPDGSEFRVIVPVQLSPGSIRPRRTGQIRLGFRRDQGGEWLELHSSGDQLLIEPRVSNAVRIRLED